MTALVDTSFVVAVTNPKDRNHERAMVVAHSIDSSLILPISVLPEVCYLLASRAGHKSMRQFLATLIASAIEIETVTRADLERATDLLNQYADSQLDFVDATIVAIAERRNISQVLTLDQRDFRIIRPRHCSHFEILP